MKAIKISDDDFSCLIEDAIFYEDDLFSPISGDEITGFVVAPRENIEKILENGWGELYPSLEDNNEEFIALAGETSWGGTGFVALRNKETNSIMWVIHLSTMNNPTSIKIDNEFVRVTTDLNYPFGVDFVIPINQPEKFIVETSNEKKKN